MEVVVNDEMAALKDKNEHLVKKLANVELEQAETEEEFEVTNQNYEATVRHLHDRIEILATTLKEKELELDNQKREILVLEKEKKLKSELIQNINEGFNKKLADANAKVEGLKAFKKEVLKKEKKIAKQNRRKVELEATKDSIESLPETLENLSDVNGNDCMKQQVQDGPFDRLDCFFSDSDPSIPALPLSPVRRCPTARTSTSLLSPHTPPGLPPSSAAEYSEQQPFEPKPTLSCYFANSAPNSVLNLKEATGSSNHLMTSDYIKNISKLDLRPRQRRNESK